MEPNKERGPYGERMIRVIVRFWTDKLREEDAHKKIAQAKGEIYLPINKNKGITTPDKILFNNLNEFMDKFQELLDNNEIKLVNLKEEYTDARLKK
ncbi:hypothetical protein CMO83_02285 [Candidatus Woesearchaeota archaeon]|jgi:hypothetical protein|nr:hypothetical protein [Candidatus Woesearchaeota archaeon]|tara:strand:+ start:9037 stop:9324 length:288 start_codon:yes stop_codon:yes gene_type:complete